MYIFYLKLINFQLYIYIIYKKYKNYVYLILLFFIIFYLLAIVKNKFF